MFVYNSKRKSFTYQSRFAKKDLQKITKKLQKKPEIQKKLVKSRKVCGYFMSDESTILVCHPERIEHPSQLIDMTGHCF